MRLQKHPGRLKLNVNANFIEPTNNETTIVAPCCEGLRKVAQW
jgi:hypothetical protein